MISRFSDFDSGIVRPAQALFCLCLAGALPASGQAEYFTDMAQASGLDFVHFNGMSGEFYLAEIMGSGAALFDYDNDGDLDVYLVQGNMIGPGKKPGDARFPPADNTLLKDRLFRNDLAPDASGSRLAFTDVTSESGIDAPGYGMGVATGDIDNDGWVDLYVTNFGRNQLLRNLGDGTFEDITERAGVGDPSWSVSAAFLDFDRDGRLDLFVGNYVHLDLERHQQCRSPSSALDYCTPLVHQAQPDRLYRNRGDGSYEDVTAKAGLHGESAPALGVMVADYNLDGWSDIYVGNDARANRLWINQQDGTFRDEAFLAGVAVNMAGAPEGSMGISSGDFDNDGDEDLFMTHLAGETNTVYVNDGHGWFEDRSIATGLGAPSKAYTGFGTGWIDYDGDGWLDVFAANGAVTVIKGLSDAADPFPLHQTNQLFANLGGKSFREVSAGAGEAFRLSEVSRGAAFGDLDNDGDTDVIVANNSGRVRLLLNLMDGRTSWLGLRLVDRSGRDALGARVEVRRAEGPSLWRTLRADGSYASANDPRILIGLGTDSEVKEVRVHWPNGRVETWVEGIPLNRYGSLIEGEGKAVADARD